MKLSDLKPRVVRLSGPEPQKAEGDRRKRWRKRNAAQVRLIKCVQRQRTAA